MLLHLLLLSMLAAGGAARDAITAAADVLQQQQAIAELVESEYEVFSRLLESNGDVLFSSDHVAQILTKSELSEVSQECREDLGIMVDSIVHPEANPGFTRHVLARMKDSGGKVGPAVLRGHIFFKGHYLECRQLNYPIEGRDRNFRGDYFRFDLDLFLRPNTVSGSCNVEVAPDLRAFWFLGVCLPASCTSTDVLHIFKPESGAAVDNPVCRVLRTADPVPEITAGFYITVSVMGVIAAVCLLAGIVDYFFTKQLQHSPITKTLAWRLFMCCSMYTNIANTFDVSNTGKSDQIGPMACMRFLSMVCVLMGHLFSNYFMIAANPGDINDLTKDITSEIIMNTLFAVDTFFFIGGVLLSYMWFKAYNKQPKATISVQGWIMFYVHRILRLSPAYFILTCFYAFVFQQLLMDTPLNMNSWVVKDHCSTTWWLDLLYVHNIFQVDKWCISWAWYLAADMQIYIFTPLLLIPLALKPTVGFIVNALFFAASTALNMFFVFYYHWPAAGSFKYPADPEATNMENYGTLMYQNPAIRCQIYIMGIMVGWLLQNKKQMKIHPIIYLPAWIIGLSLMLTVLLGLHDQTNGFLIPLFWRAMYSGLSRVAWGAGLAVIIIMSFYGYGGPIDSFMSWHIWAPLGRLSYSAYLIHIPIMILVLGQTKDEEYFSTFLEFFITRIIGMVATIYLFATFWSACFEISFARIEKLLLIDGLTAKKVAPKVTIDETKTEIPWGSNPEKNEVPYGSDPEKQNHFDNNSEKVRF